MLTPADHKKIRYHASRMIGHRLLTKVTTGHLPMEGVESYSAGLIAEIRDFLATYVSDEVAFNVLTNVAEKAEEPLLRARDQDR